MPGETQDVTLVIPGTPPSLNRQERLHWAKRQRLRDWWAQQAWLVWIQAGKPRFERPVIQYRLYYRTNRRRDADNAIASCKPILDGLKGHAFEDDHSGVVTILPPIIGVDKQRPRVEIVIRETWGVSRERVGAGQGGGAADWSVSGNALRLRAPGHRAGTVVRTRGVVDPSRRRRASG